MPVPDVTVAALMVVELVGDLVSYGEMQVEDAVAAFDGLQAKLTVVDAGLVVDEAEAMGVIHAWLALPAAAVVNGDVVVLMRGDVHQHRVLAFAVNRVVLQADEEGVVVDMDIIKTISRVKLAGADHVAFDDVLLSGVDGEVGGVAG